MVKFKRKLIKFIVNALKLITILKYSYFKIFTKINFMKDFMEVIMVVNIIIKFKSKFMDFMFVVVVEVEIIVMFLFLVVFQMHFQIKDE